MRLLELVRRPEFFFEVVEFELGELFFRLAVLVCAILVFAHHLLLLCEALKFAVST